MTKTIEPMRRMLGATAENPFALLADKKTNRLLTTEVKKLVKKHVVANLGGVQETIDAVEKDTNNLDIDYPDAALTDTATRDLIYYYVVEQWLHNALYK